MIQDKYSFKYIYISIYTHLRLKGVIIINDPDLVDAFVSSDSLKCYPLNRSKCKHSGINSDFGLPSWIRDCVTLTIHLLSACDIPQRKLEDWSVPVCCIGLQLVWTIPFAIANRPSTVIDLVKRARYSFPKAIKSICYKTLISKGLLVNAVPRWELIADEVNMGTRDFFLHHSNMTPKHVGRGWANPPFWTPVGSIHCLHSFFIPEVCVGSRYSPLLICLMRFLWSKPSKGIVP